MKTNYWVVALIFMPFYVFSNSDNATGLKNYQSPANKNTDVITYSNETDLKKTDLFARNLDYPTQIIRMEHNIEELQITCNEVQNQIDELLVQHIVNTNFTYSIYISCHYHPQTKLAIQFIINSYFDPLNDEAIPYLEAYLAKYNNTDLLGAKYKIEAAKGLIVSLGIAAGVRKKFNSPPFIEYRKDRSNFYFKSNYEMKNKLISDIYQNFFTQDPNKIFPFLEKWIASKSSSIYKAVLRDANYVELLPEKIFIMNNEEDIFVSNLKQYFAHNCEPYENHKCLNPEAQIDLGENDSVPL
jgi:hypothetical protein